ncbi:type II toxin-antitoxin system RelE/ParE family toxin [Propionicimonas sp.]|uniref:type II toxin-antitoxin system RelE/ParE family toxin n=1 Tax=Propionicimonas sp. TaxID=1955623 RepID=UPI0039E65D90
MEAIRVHCEGLAVFPHRGTLREDLRPGLRVTHFRKRVAIAIVVDDNGEQVTVLGIFSGGQDDEAILGE